MSLTPSTETKLRTRQEALDWLKQSGTTIAAWARTNGFSYHVVYRIISGLSKGGYGEGHRAAVLLGLKTPPEATHAH